MRRNDGFVVVFDLTMKQSLEELVTFVEGIKRVKEEDTVFKSIPFVIVGNKADLAEQRKVTKKEVQQFIVDHLELDADTPYFESSAKNRVLCDEPFEALVRRMNKLKINTNKPTSQSEGKGLFSSVSSNAEKDGDLKAFSEL